MAIALVALAVSGCAKELYNPGGYADSMMDKVFPADTKKQRLLRAYLIQASMIRLAAFAPATSSQKSLMMEMAYNATDRFDEAYACAYRGKAELADNPNNSKFQDDGCFYYDSIMIGYENVLFDMAMFNISARDREVLAPLAVLQSPSFLFSGKAGVLSLKRWAGDIAGAAATLSPMDMIDGLLQISQQAYATERPFGALYRDVQDFMAKKGIKNNAAFAPDDDDYLEIYEMIVLFCSKIGADRDDRRCVRPPTNLSRFLAADSGARALFSQSRGRRTLVVQTVDSKRQPVFTSPKILGGQAIAE